jgi:hypothetical protein
MARKKYNPQSKSDEPHCDDPQQTVLERVQELTWALLDGEISDDEVSLLDTLLLTGDDARNRYIECVQLHTDLMAHYAEPSRRAGNGSAKSPVAGVLNAGSSLLGLPTPRATEP